MVNEPSVFEPLKFYCNTKIEQLTVQLMKRVELKKYKEKLKKCVELKKYKEKLYTNSVI